MNNNILDVVGIRLIKEREILSNRALRSPIDTIEVLANELKLLDREMLMTINLDNKLKNPVCHIVCMGGIDSVNVDIKSIFKTALLSNSSNIILIHNHPSGECTPSKFDLAITQRIDEACKLMGMSLKDHIVVGYDKYYSIMCKKEFPYDKEVNIEKNFEQELDEPDICD